MEGNIDILGKPFDQAVSLGKRRPALENQLIAQLRKIEQRIQSTTNPVVLFNDGGSNAEPQRYLIKRLSLLFGSECLVAISGHVSGRVP